MLYIRRKIMKTLGAEHGELYMGAAAMLMESGLPYGIISLIFVVLYGINNTAAILFIPLTSQLEVRPDIMYFLSRRYLTDRSFTFTVHRPASHPAPRRLGSRMDERDDLGGEPDPHQVQGPDLHA